MNIVIILKMTKKIGISGTIGAILQVGMIVMVMRIRVSLGGNGRIEG
jgi:hypothetical protein